jgi:hypothetical protein
MCAPDALSPKGRRTRGLALGAAVSIAANVLAQFPDQAAAAGPIVSAWPPRAFYGTHRLLHGIPAVNRPSRQSQKHEALAKRRHQDKLTPWIP